MFARTRRTLDEAEAITLEIEVGALEPIIAHALGREHLNGPSDMEACGCEDWSDHEYAASLPVTHPAYCDGSLVEPNAKGCFHAGPCGCRFV